MAVLFHWMFSEQIFWQNLTLSCIMSQNGQTHSKILQQMLQDFFSVFDHFGTLSIKELKVQSCELYNSKYMIASTQITNAEIFALITVLGFTLFSRTVLFIKKKDNRSC